MRTVWTGSLTAAIVTAVVLAGCGGQPDPATNAPVAATTPAPADDGVRMIPVEGGAYKVWTRRVGAGEVKVLLLHGGPGFSHEYLTNFADHLPAAGYELYFYDQLGSWLSDKPDDPSLWTVQRFRDEVETVRQALGLDDFVLIGQSWGGMLGIEYALEHQDHLRGLVISNMVASIPSYVEGINELRAQMPPDKLAVMERYEKAGDYHNPEYEEILFGELYSKHICRLDPWPEPLMNDFQHFNTSIYNQMQGPSEFEVTGTFKDWDRWDDLNRIEVPTLLIVGRYDTMRVSDVEEMNRRIPDSQLLVCENGSHLANWDDEEAYFSGLLRFLEQLRAE